jgi:hypothetical protein
MTMTMIRMKPVLALAICAAAFCCQPAHGQQGPKDAGTPKTDTLPREVKVTIQLGKDSTLAATDTVSRDTSHYGPVTVIVESKDGKGNAKIKAVLGHGNAPDRSKNVDFSYLGFELGLNNFSDRSDYGSPEVNAFAPAAPGGPEAGPGEFSLRTGKSVNVNIWPVWMKVNLVDHKLNLKTGFGVEMNNYRYTKSITYQNDASRTYVVRDSVRFKKNKLFTEYLTIPVLLDFESNPYHNARSFRLSAGPTFGYLIKSRTKQVSKARGKVKQNDPFNLEQFRVGLRGEIGFGPVTLYGAYSFTAIHQYGLKQYPYSVGIELIGDNGW